MSTKIIDRIYLKRFLNAQLKRLPGLVLVIMAIQIQQANAQDLVLQDTTITTTATFSASSSITAGPNFTIASTGNVTFEYGDFITLNPGFVIIAGGQLHAVSGVPTGLATDEDDPVLPSKIFIHQNFPNPFNPTTTISYQLSGVSDVELAIYNQLGQEVRALVNKRQPASLYQIQWDGRDNAGKQVVSGVYLYRLKAGSFVQVRKMVLIR